MKKKRKPQRILDLVYKSPYQKVHQTFTRVFIGLL
jgi:hypothetical protein